jgi:2-succinyl-5-enolpyruvyl-6-hydroxy-3-cyclohexene-1-carboxylate synthase
MNSLALLSQIKQPVTIVVINNDGGRIFEQLPIKQHSRAIEQLFVAPHGLHFDQLAAMYSIDYTRAETGSHFVEAIKTATKSKRSSIIEAVVDSETSSQHRQHLVASVNSAIDELGP